MHFARFNLELNAEKTRLIEFGPFAAENRRRRGLGRPETFSFLGFTHICGKTRAGRFALRRKTIAKKMTAKLREVNALLMQRRHWPIPEQGQWLGSVLRGRGGDVISRAARSGVLDERAHAARAQLSQDIEHGRVVPPGIAGTDAQPSGQ